MKLIWHLHKDKISKYKEERRKSLNKGQYYRAYMLQRKIQAHREHLIRIGDMYFLPYPSIYTEDIRPLLEIKRNSLGYYLSITRVTISSEGAPILTKTFYKYYRNIDNLLKYIEIKYSKEIANSLCRSFHCPYLSKHPKTL